ncbi:MAG: tRNA (adenosine(37)-N6)-threonylcarbamoyltransferase complex dimerization subunit type 1 TsaB [Phycisphaerales bacterium]
MLTLAIEATNPNVPTPGVLLARVPADEQPPEVLATRGLASTGRHDDVLLPSIATLFDEAGIEPRELDEVLVSIGPGGFTATRLACVTAAVLAEATGARVRAAETARVAIETVFQDHNVGGSVVVAMASKHNDAYVAKFDLARGTFLSRGESVGPAAFDTLLLPGDRLVFEGHLPQGMLEIASSRGVECIPMRLTSEGLLACREVAEIVSIEALRPIYPREPDAVTQWRRRYGSAPGDA